MTEYSVQTTNIFALLGDDAAPQQKKTEQAASRKQTREQKPQTAQVAPKKQAQSTPKPTTTTTQAPRKSGAATPKATASAPQSNRQKPPVRKENVDERGSQLQERRNNQPREFAGGQKAKGVRIGKYEEKQFAQKEREGKTRGRLYDRRPGTGRSLVENKKAGGGKGNWGKNIADELAAGERAPEDVTAEKTTDAATKEAKPEGDDAEAEKSEDEEETITFEEWQQQQAAKTTTKHELPNKLRAAGEGVSEDPKWAEATQYKKPVAEDPRPVKTAAKTSKGKGKQRKPEGSSAASDTKSLMNDLFQFTTPDRRGGGRGRGRGGPRTPGSGAGRGQRREGGGGGRPKPKKFSPQTTAPQFNDESSFPALSSGAKPE